MGSLWAALHNRLHTKSAHRDIALWFKLHFSHPANVLHACVPTVCISKSDLQSGPGWCRLSMGCW